MSLLSGMESNERVSLLLKLTKISSEDVIAAIYHHLCNGVTTEHAAIIHDIKPGQLSRAMTKLNAINDIVEDIKECDWAHIKKSA